MGKLMVYGTTSSAGKSLITTGLCRILSNMSYRVSPFKSQNMSRNFAYTTDGKVISTAQVLQAYAARQDLDVRMNPVLLVPSSDTGSKVYVEGDYIGHMEARQYFQYKKDLGPKIKEIFEDLYKEVDHIVIEGAGSPAEINLLDNDFVNTGMARLADAKAILVVDIDRGGAFAHLYGTYFILAEEDRKKIKGFVINKFRGDPSILKPGIDQIEKLTGTPVLGLLPYKDYKLPDEDSLSENPNNKKLEEISKADLDQAIEGLAKDMAKYLHMEKIMELLT